MFGCYIGHVCIHNVRGTLAVLQQLLRMDQAAVIRISGRRNALLDLLMKSATRLGDGHVWGLIGLALLFTEEEILFKQLALAFAVELTVFKSAKRLFSRPRPFVCLPQVTMLVIPPDEFSFPSGHTAAAFVVATVVGLGVTGMLVPLTAVAMLIGLSRVYLGVHYPSDVAAGAVLGGLSGSFALAVV
jgi:undecaprenyl-diphosphatase